MRQGWIESLVLQHTMELVQNHELLDFIAENTYCYYLEQNTVSAYTHALHNELDAVNKAIANLVKALEAGIFNATTKARMDELDEQRLGL